MHRLLSTTAPAAVIWVRLLVGAVFLSEGVQKLLFPEALGAGRFLEIGIPAPHLMAPFVGALEVVCGTLILIGLLRRPAACLLLVNISVALISTKLPHPVRLWVPGFCAAAPAALWLLEHGA